MATVTRKKRKLVIGKPVAKQAKSAAPAPESRQFARVSTDRYVHDITSTYSGVSPALNARKSRTPLRTEDFGSAPNLVLSERDESVLRPLKSKYGRKSFVRGNVDTGILNRAIRKGVLQHIGGDATHEAAQLQFVR